jgi:hypothetical protein
MGYSSNIEDTGEFLEGNLLESGHFEDREGAGIFTLK